jgi:endonuclease/exonuclease/phosphatase family metal-dependent hydrolase
MAHPEARSIVVATHNLMHGLRVEALLPHYVELREREGLDLLCLQEDRYVQRDAADGYVDGDQPSARIAAALGAGYEVVRDDDCPGLAFVIDRRTFGCEERGAIPLPRLSSLSWFERRYIVGGRTKQKYALFVRLGARGAAGAVTAISFHLDTAGGNRHRQAQMRALAEALVARELHQRLVACGDTNAFAWRRRPATLSSLLAPLAALGATDPAVGSDSDARPTHYFARQHEPKVPHRIGVILGKLGIDIPLRYDVICTTLPVQSRGQTVTPASDHDLVWARVALQSPSP